MIAEPAVEMRVRACLDRIAERDRVVRAWSHLDADQALAEARRLDALPPGERRPLHGMAVGIKDVFLTRDMPTRYGSSLYRNFAPAIDAAAVAILRTAGAVLLGKTHTVEFAAIGAKPPTRNPANLAHTPGGSSSGSAAAVADGHVPLALGTQTGGSIIRPASFCGVWALKPSWGLVDRDGAKAFAPSLDTVGWFGRSAADLALLLTTFAPRKASAQAIAPDALRVAFCRTPMWAAAGPATHRAFAIAEAALRAAGTTIAHLGLPILFDNLADDHRTVMFGEGTVSFLSLAREHGIALDPVFRDMVDRPPGDDALRRAYDRAAIARPLFDTLAAEFDAVIVPSVPGEAPAGLADGGSYIFNGLWTLLHIPCVNIPGLVGPQGLPIGLTAIGPRFADGHIIAAAEVIAAAIADYAARSRSDRNRPAAAIERSASAISRPSVR